MSDWPEERDPSRRLPVPRRVKAKRPARIWANGINLAGLWFNEPKAMRWRGDSYWDSSGNFDVEGVGQKTTMRGNIVTFASESKRETELWTAGALAILGAINRWSAR